MMIIHQLYAISCCMIDLFNHFLPFFPFFFFLSLPTTLLGTLNPLSLGSNLSVLNCLKFKSGFLLLISSNIASEMPDTELRSRNFKLGTSLMKDLIPNSEISHLFSSKWTKLGQAFSTFWSPPSVILVKPSFNVCSLIKPGKVGGNPALKCASPLDRKLNP